MNAGIEYRTEAYSTRKAWMEEANRLTAEGWTINSWKTEENKNSPMYAETVLQPFVYIVLYERKIG